MKKFSLVKTAGIVIAFWAATTILSSAQTFTNLASFSNATTGHSPQGGLVQGTDGNFYGTNTFGGPDFHDAGTVFKVTPSGAVTVLHSFFCSNTNCQGGGEPMHGLILGADGNFYGLTSSGGATISSIGTVFRITPAGKLTTIYSFCALANCLDGEFPTGLAQGSDGNFYGTTSAGGTSGSFGTVFRLTPGGKLTTLYNFCPGGNGGNCTDGRNPQGGFIQARNGNFYGVTFEGGANGSAGGTVFEITPAGHLTTL